MGFGPKTRSEAKKYRYGTWAARPAGEAFDPECCAEQVSEGGRSLIFHQCRRPPGYGPDKLFCRQHDPEAAKKRAIERERRFREQTERERPKWYGVEMLEIIREIAAGHNDPGTLCQVFIKKYDKNT